jgi:hypothetical protein
MTDTQPPGASPSEPASGPVVADPPASGAAPATGDGAGARGRTAVVSDGAAAAAPEPDGAGEREGTAAEPTASETAAGGRSWSDRLSDRLVGRLALAFTLAPFVVSAVWLVVTVGGEYKSVSDHALTEMHTADVGRHEVLVGLYSRGDWNHPGPALFYVLAPFYRLFGERSIGISLGALAINGAAVAGMGLLARRRGGIPLMVVTLLSCGLLMRTLGADFLSDPWNCFVTTLPFGALVFLAWTLWAGEAWALPVAAAVTTFLAQAHVGFVALAVPLLAWGAIGLVRTTLVERDASGTGGPRVRAAARRLARPTAVTVAVLALGWLPALVDHVRHSPGNLREIWSWFRYPDEPAQTVGEGWRVLSAQFGGAPEWLTYKRPFSWLGESPYMLDAPVPWLLAVVAVAGVVLWRLRAPRALPLLATLALTFVVGVVAVARTVGPAFDYRLRWTFIPPMIGLAVIGWAAWLLVGERWPGVARRALPAIGLAGLAALGAVNVVTATQAGVPQGDDSAAVASLTQQVRDYLSDTDGTVVVTDGSHSGAWQARGLVWQLEQAGVDVAVRPDRVDQYGRHRVRAGQRGVGAVLVVTSNQRVDQVAAQPGMRMIAEWETLPAEERAPLLAESDRLWDGIRAGHTTFEEVEPRLAELDDMLNGDASVAWRVAVFVDDGALDESAGNVAAGDEPAVGDAPA